MCLRKVIIKKSESFIKAYKPFVALEICLYARRLVYLPGWLVFGFRPQYSFFLVGVPFRFALSQTFLGEFSVN